jgi:hypothetical protein
MAKDLLEPAEVLVVKDEIGGGHRLILGFKVQSSKFKVSRRSFNLEP